MSDKNQKEELEKLKKLKDQNLPEHIQKSIDQKQKALENNQVIRK